MPLAYKYSCNEDIKRLLKKHKITYEELAMECWYSKSTISQWMCSPLSKNHRDIIIQAVEEVAKRRNPEPVAPSSVNYAIRVDMAEYGISYSELARKVGVTQSTMYKWIVKGRIPISKKKSIEDTITEIKEGRRLSHAD